MGGGGAFRLKWRSGGVWEQTFTPPHMLEREDKIDVFYFLCSRIRVLISTAKSNNHWFLSGVYVSVLGCVGGVIYVKINPAWRPRETRTCVGVLTYSVPV